MTHLTLVFLLVPGTTLVTGEPSHECEHRPFVFMHVAVIDTAAPAVQKDMTVLVIGDHIADVGKAAKVKVPKSAQVIDAQGKFLIPGLWDMHVHLFNYPSGRPPNVWHFLRFLELLP
jgi:imidazolonepropionase-like amidohydrolase